MFKSYDRRSRQIPWSEKEREKGRVTFGDDVSTKILGKGTVILGNNRDKEENVLLIENLKPNLLSVSQTCDQGHVARDCDMKRHVIPRLRKVWRRKSEVQSKKDDEHIAPKIDKVDNRRMMGEVPNKECENQSFPYKVDQDHERRVLKE
jgi:hypothetical protein